VRTRAQRDGGAGIGSSSPPHAGQWALKAHQSHCLPRLGWKSPVALASWIASQIASHRATLALGQRELANGQEATVKALATASAPVVQRHLDMALAAAQKYGVPTSVPAGSGGQAATSPRLLGLGVAVGGLVLLATTVPVLVRRARA